MSEYRIVDPFIAFRPENEGALPGEELRFTALPAYVEACEAHAVERQARRELAVTDDEITAATGELQKATLVNLGARAIHAANTGDENTQRETVECFNTLSANIYPRMTPAGAVLAVRELRDSIGSGQETLIEERAEFLRVLEEVEILAQRRLAPGEKLESGLRRANREEVRAVMREAFMDAHGAVVEAIESDWAAIRRNPDRPQAFLPDDVLEIYRRDLRRLARDDHESWADWKAVLEKGVKGYRTWSHDHTIFSAELSRPFSLTETLDLVPHEMYVHALRGNNGEIYGIDMRAGYPNYEEQHGMFIGSVVSGYKASASAFSYLATGLARGDLGRVFTRKELFRVRELNLLLERTAYQEKGIEKSIGDPNDIEEIQDLAARAVNRIVKLEGQPARGISPMILTYAGAYYDVGGGPEDFTAAALRQGYTAAAILRYLELGHFSPVKASDTEYVNRRLQEIGKGDWIIKV